MVKLRASCFSDEAVKVVATDNHSASLANQRNYAVVAQTSAERDEEEPETGESDMEVEERMPGNYEKRRKRGGDSLTLDEDELSELESEQEDAQVVAGDLLQMVLNVEFIFLSQTKKPSLIIQIDIPTCLKKDLEVSTGCYLLNLQLCT